MEKVSVVANKIELTNEQSIATGLPAQIPVEGAVGTASLVDSIELILRRSESLSD